jgi:hypothetical protein
MRALAPLFKDTIRLAQDRKTLFYKIPRISNNMSGPNSKSPSPRIRMTSIGQLFLEPRKGVW